MGERAAGSPITVWRLVLGYFQWFLSFPLQDQVPDGAPTPAFRPLAASTRPFQTELSAQKQPSFRAPVPPTLHPSVPRTPPEPHRSTLDSDRGYYGEAPVRLWRNERAAVDAIPPITLPFLVCLTGLPASSVSSIL